MAREPRRSLLRDVTHPMHRLHVVLERGTPEEPDLREVRRTETGLAALALDRLDHRGLFAADVGAGAAAEMNGRNRAGRIGLKRRDLAFENRAASVIFVAKVDVDFVDADSPRGDERAFDEAM